MEELELPKIEDATISTEGSAVYKSGDRFHAKMEVRISHPNREVLMQLVERLDMSVITAHPDIYETILTTCKRELDEARKKYVEDLDVLNSRIVMLEHELAMAKFEPD